MSHNPPLPIAARPRQVYVFSTCIVDLMAPQAGVDVIRLIREGGIEVVFPRAQSCCGQPAHSSGYTDEARRVAAAQLDLFPEPWPVVVPSGSCAGMMVHHWPGLFAGDARRLAQASDIAARVVEFSAFARDVLGLAAATQATPAAASVLPTPADAVATATATAEATTASRPADLRAQGAAGPGGSAASAIKVALHTSCAARREMGTHVPSEALLRAMPGVELVQPLRVAECCGFGGTFSARHPAISGAMVNDKLDAVRDSGAEVLVSADCGCLLNLHHAAEKRRGQGEVLPRVVHLASFLRERQGATDAARQVTD